MNTQLTTSQKTELLNTYTTLVTAHAVLNYLDGMGWKPYPISRKVHSAAHQLGLSKTTATRTVKRIVTPFGKQINLIEDFTDNMRATMKLFQEQNKLTIGDMIADNLVKMRDDLSNRLTQTIEYLEAHPMVVAKLNLYLEQDIM